MTTVCMSARLVAHPTARRELLQALLDWAATARHEHGTRESLVYEDAEAPATFGLIGEWESMTALENHLRSDAFGVLLGAIELLARPTGLTVAGVSERHREAVLPAFRRMRERARDGAESPGAA
jgi:quinol monooxygenase YgiN